jgi:hypothetical protein
MVLPLPLALIRGEVGNIAKNLGQGQTWGTDASHNSDRAIRESAAATRCVVTGSDIVGYGTGRIAAHRPSRRLVKDRRPPEKFLRKLIRERSRAGTDAAKKAGRAQKSAISVVAWGLK